MYTKEQEETALAEFALTGSVYRVIQRLGYPSKSTLYRWLEHKQAGLENWHGTTKRDISGRTHFGCTEEHPRHPSAALKLEILRRCFENGEDVEYVSRETGYSRTSIYKWRRQYLKKGAAYLMPSKKDIKRSQGLFNEEDNPHKSSPFEVVVLRSQIQELRLEVDILKETIDVLKKDPGADKSGLRNQEKAAIVDALKNKYPLPVLLEKLNFSRSSYYYQRKKQKQPDKYSSLQKTITSVFQANNSCYGYRRIHEALRKQGTIISEKIIRRIMRENGLYAVQPRTRKYNSYLGEISPAVNNVIDRDFHAEKPNKKWLTDITEFAIPEGKVYLSPIIDCFDGMVISWSIGTSPNATLVNSMLDKAIAQLPPNEYPVIHSDRGCHYRWPEWICKTKQAGLTRSMSRKGCSPDNSACEGFFGRLKNEMFYGRQWIGVSIAEFIEHLHRYIIWYNEDRIKMSLGAMSPVQYRSSLGLTN